MRGSAQTRWTPRHFGAGSHSGATLASNPESRDSPMCNCTLWFVRSLSSGRALRGPVGTPRNDVELFDTLRNDLLQQRHQRFRRGNVGRMAGVDLIITPTNFAFGTTGKSAKGI